MYYHNEARIKAIAASGIKANICSGVMVFDPEQRFEGSAEQKLNAELVRDYHNTLDGRLRIDLNLHSEYISNEHYVRGTAEQAMHLGVGTHVHASETRLEHEQSKERHGGQTPIEYFDALGLFATPCTAAHCVYTEPADWEIMAAKGVTAAANPASNLKLGSGVAPLAQMLDAGVNVTLGTDGVASNNNHNLFKEIYLAALLNKGVTGDPTLISPQQALAFATTNGAASQGRTDCGSIEQGKKADLVVLDTDVPWMQPVHNALNNLVYSAQGSDVELTMVDGRVLYRDGEWPTIDVERAGAQTQAAAQTILSLL
jgi:5-methylthioadenosine/S-adenosylhomocysteine deaminase